MLDKTEIDLSEYRLIKAKDLLSQAKLLFDNDKFDGSINRSYYAIVNAIRSLLALLNLDSSKHSGVLSFFDKYLVKTSILEKEFSKIAHSAFNVRQDNDYEDFYIPSKEEAKKQPEDAEAFLDEIEKKRNLFINKEIELPIID